MELVLFCLKHFKGVELRSRSDKLHLSLSFLCWNKWAFGWVAPILQRSGVKGMLKLCWGLGAENSGLREVNIASQQKRRMRLKHTEAKAAPRKASFCLQHGFNKAAKCGQVNQPPTKDGNELEKLWQVCLVTLSFIKENTTDLLKFQRQL